MDDNETTMHDAIVVTSPTQHGEHKDQDSARWFPACGIAAVADGVTSSPHSGVGARTATDLSPIFGGKVDVGLAAISGKLSAERLEALYEPATFAPDVAAPMRRIMEAVVKDKLAQSFQTTLVAVCLTPTDDGVVVERVQCGDSAFFAFAEDGELLTTTVPLGTSAGLSDDLKTELIMRFGPKDELLVKLLDDCTGRDHGLHVPKAGWALGIPIDQCVPTSLQSGAVDDDSTLWLTRDDVLVIPLHLTRQRPAGLGSGYVRVRYCSLIRRATENMGALPFDHRTNVTAVLPDHCNTRRCAYHRDHFGPGTEFVLASDGFYSAFDTPYDMWNWLIRNSSALHDAEQTADVMRSLHDRLHTSDGDDDISFVWIRPLSLTSVATDQEPNLGEPHHAE